MSRLLTPIPPFLRRLSGRLSDYILEKVSGQYDLLQIHHGATTSQTDKSNPWRWSVPTKSSMANCDVKERSCSCPFFSSIALLWEHLMRLARDELELEELPDCVLKE
ncbi:hypothetical protein PybrP1_006945 [[Pythium] brassicae (nom. inval.)]|nr:hypothetical protein PybrP1_006945 [[Pythium] brassicae (nom. inval.)]